MKKGNSCHYVYRSLDHKEHRRCECGKLMIKRVSNEIDNVIDGKPIKAWYWWCNCGETMTGGVLRGLEETTWAKQEWKRVNNIR